jgi:hypothetical protein
VGGASLSPESKLATIAEPPTTNAHQSTRFTFAFPAASGEEGPSDAGPWGTIV